MKDLSTILQPHGYLWWKHHCLSLGHHQKGYSNPLWVIQSICLTMKVKRHDSPCCKQKESGETLQHLKAERANTLGSIVFALNFYTVCWTAVFFICSVTEHFIHLVRLCSRKSIHMMHLPPRAVHHRLETLPHCACKQEKGLLQDWRTLLSPNSCWNGITALRGTLSSVQHLFLPPLSPEEAGWMDLAGWNITSSIHSHK